MAASEPINTTTYTRVRPKEGVVRPVRALAQRVEWLVPRARARLSTLRWSLSLAEFGAGSLIAGRARIASPATFKVGSRVFIGANAVISAVGGLTIEDDVMIGNDLNVQGGNHAVGADRRDVPHDPARNPPMTIGKGAWLGSRVTLLAGADIGPYAVVAAGAVVTGPVEPWTMVGGIPARVIKRLNSDGRDQTDRRNHVER